MKTERELDRADRLAIVLFYGYGASIERIAKLLRVTEEQVKEVVPKRLGLREKDAKETNEVL